MYKHMYKCVCVCACVCVCTCLLHSQNKPTTRSPPPTYIPLKIPMFDHFLCTQCSTTTTSNLIQYITNASEAGTFIHHKHHTHLIHTHIVQAHVQVCACVCVRACVRACVHACLHACVCTSVDVCMAVLAH